MPETITLKDGTILHRTMSLVAFTPSKWGKRLGGIDGVYDAGTRTTYNTLSERIAADSKANRQPATLNDVISVYDKQKSDMLARNKRLDIHEQQLIEQSQGKGYKLKAFEE